MNSLFTIEAEISHGDYRKTLQASAPTIPQALRKLGKLSTYCIETDYQVNKVTSQLNDPKVVKAGLGWVWYRVTERPSCTESRPHEGVGLSGLTRNWRPLPCPQGSPASAGKT